MLHDAVVKESIEDTMEDQVVVTILSVSAITLSSRRSLGAGLGLFRTAEDGVQVGVKRIFAITLRGNIVFCFTLA